MIARAAEGSARDALSLLDQAIAHAARRGLGRRGAARCSASPTARWSSTCSRRSWRGDVAARACAPEGAVRCRRRSGRGAGGPRRLHPHRHPPEARRDRRRGRGADRGGDARAARRSPASCRSARSPAPGRCCSRASRRRSEATPPARRRRHGDRAPRPCRRPADARRGAAGARRRRRRRRPRAPARRARPAEAPRRAWPPAAAAAPRPRRASPARAPAPQRPRRAGAAPRDPSPISSRSPAQKRELKLKHALETDGPPDPLRARPDRDRADRRRAARPCRRAVAEARAMDRHALDGRGRPRRRRRDHRRGAQADARARLVDDARADPLVAAVLARFPGAEIVDVRVPAAMTAAGRADDLPPTRRRSRARTTERWRSAT